MSKILSISIAAYNVEKYIEKTLNSLIIKNLDLLEVLIVNDGSKDKTLEIAKKFEEKYPETFRVIDKENGGYGSTINEGIKNATGKYFKQLDGDDWYFTENLDKLCNDLIDVDEDIIYTPYIKHRITDGDEQIVSNDAIKYSETKDLNEIIKYVNPVFYMHNIAFKTEILKANNIKIDEHCFYTDTEYVIFPMIYCKTIKFLEYPIYVYRYGDENQSVGIEGRKKHYKDHLKMSNSMLEKYSEISKLPTNIKDYFDEYLATIFSSGIGNYLMLLKPTKENYKLIKEYDSNVKKTSESVYKRMNKYSKSVKAIRKSNYIIYYIFNKLRKIKDNLK